MPVLIEPESSRGPGAVEELVPIPQHPSGSAIPRAIGDTRPLWQAWLADAAKVLGLDAEAAPNDRVEAASALDAAGAGNWRTLLERFAEDHAPVYLRPGA